MTRIALFVLLVSGLIMLNMFPPEELSIDPWLCRSDAGAENIQNWGWPQIVVTEFNEIGDNAKTRHRLTGYFGLAPNLITAWIGIRLITFGTRSHN